jgi:tetratricopeptide (TPR) repeat protein
MNSESLLELIEAAEELISRETVQRHSTSGSQVPSMLAELKERVMREYPQYAGSGLEELAKQGIPGSRVSAALKQLKERIQCERQEYSDYSQGSSISISNTASVNVNISIGGNDKRDYALQHYTWGHSLLSQNVLKGAEDAFKKTLEIDPAFIGAHSSLGFIYYKQGRLDESVLEYIAETRLDPRNAKAHYNLASVLHYQQKIDEAKKQYQIAADLGYNSAKEMLAKLGAAK